MHENTGFFATWLPGDSIEIGDVGLFEQGRFRKLGSLQEMGIKFSAAPGRSFQDINYSSTSYTKIAVNGTTEDAALGKASISVGFLQAGAFLFQASKVQIHQLENRIAIVDRILEAHLKKKWDPAWLLVESLHAAERATIIVSEDQSADLVLSAQSNAALSAVSLANPNVSLAVTSSRGRMLQIIGGEKVHPLYSCFKLKVPLLGKPVVRPVRGVAAVETVESISRPTIADLLASFADGS